jgi:hypothetical protein
MLEVVLQIALFEALEILYLNLYLSTIYRTFYFNRPTYALFFKITH